MEDDEWWLRNFSMVAEPDEELSSQDDHNLPPFRDDDSSERRKPRSSSDARIYNTHKPKWWKRRSRQASKGQRRAIQEMKEYIIDKPPFGTMIDWERVFANHQQGPLTDRGDIHQPSSGTVNYQYDIWLEIGFGSGENLLFLSQLYANDPSKRLVGTEVYSAGLGKICQSMQLGIQRQQHWTGYTVYADGPPEETPPATADRGVNIQIDRWEKVSTDGDLPYNNLRIFCGDGIKLLPHVPDQSLAAILVAFPDPFPRNHEKEWRLIQVRNLQEFYRGLREENGRFYLASDHEGYMEWAHQMVGQFNDSMGFSAFQWLEPCPARQAWLPVVSKYEQKGWAEGRRTLLSCWEKRGS